MSTDQRRQNSQLQDIQGEKGGRELIWYTCEAIQVLLTTMEQRPKVVRDIVLTCVVLHNMLRSHQGAADRPPTPADDIQPPQADQGELGHHDNLRNPSREAKHRYLLKEYFNHMRTEFKKTEGENILSSISPFQDYSNNPRTFI